VIRVHLVDKYGAMLPSMTVKVTLPITIYIELAHHPSPRNGRFPDRRSHNLAVPCQVAWKADIY